ncbi:hypothetical protein DYH09_01550 [bacterium CPR1]|nr:hypothetical protein [bacterium CPR1]
MVAAALGRSFPDFVLHSLLGLPLALFVLTCLFGLQDENRLGQAFALLAGGYVMLHPSLRLKLLHGLPAVGFWVAAVCLPDLYTSWAVRVRRRLVARVGLKRLRSLITAEVADRDQDAQGMQRRLLVWDFVDDEPIVAVEVVCPSTGQDYLLRVPPTTRCCADAVAWTFEMSVGSYHPQLET